MGDEKRAFACAVVDNDYCEVELVRGVWLITDWREDTLFMPFMVIENDEYLDEQDIMDLLNDEVSEIFTTQSVWIDQGDGIARVYPERIHAEKVIA